MMTMLIDIHYLDEETGERRIHQERRDIPPEPDWQGRTGRESEDRAIVYYYGLGNLACDCNRAREFFDDFGDHAVHPCGHERFTIEKIVEHGAERLIYQDTLDGFGGDDCARTLPDKYRSGKGN